MADKLEGHDSATGGSIPYSEDDGAPWDLLKLGPSVLPGTWTVTGASGRKIDVKTTRGQDGARFRDQGYEPAPLTLVGTLVGATDWNAMVKINKLLQPRKRGVAVEPLEAQHPAFTFLGVTNVIVKRVFAPSIDGGQITCSMEVLEWMPKPKKKPVAKDVPVSQFGANLLVGGDNLILRSTSPATDTPTYFGGVAP